MSYVYMKVPALHYAQAKLALLPPVASYYARILTGKTVSLNLKKSMGFSQIKIIIPSFL